MFRFLHLADILLEQPLGQYPERRQRQMRRATGYAFRYAIDRAIREQVDAVVIAGRLFGTASPSSDSIAFVNEQLNRLRRASIACVYVDHEGIRLSSTQHGVGSVHRLSTSSSPQAVTLPGTDGTATVCLAALGTAPGEQHLDAEVLNSGVVQISLVPSPGSERRAPEGETARQSLSYLAAGGEAPHESDETWGVVRSPGRVLRFTPRGADISQGLLVTLSCSNVIAEGESIRSVASSPRTRRQGEGRHNTPYHVSTPMHRSRSEEVAAMQGAVREPCEAYAYTNYRSHISCAQLPHSRGSLMQALEALDKRAISELVSHYGQDG